MITLGSNNIQVTGLTADSRNVRPGFLYAALPGTRVHGLNFVDDVLAKGATALLVPAHAAASLFGKGVAVVPSLNVRRDFAKLVAEAYPKVPARVAAVTGTNGKTSIAHFLRQLLTASNSPAISAGTLGLQPSGIADLPALTSPDAVSLFKALSTAKQQGFNHLVIEASSHGLDQNRIDGLEIDAAAFTNLTQDHLDYHHDFPAYGAAKQRLFKTLLKPDGIAVLNADDPFTEQLRALPRRHWTYGWTGKDLRLVSATPTAQGLRLACCLFGKNITLDLPLIGSFQGHNLLAALGLGSALAVPMADLLAAVPTLTSVPGRMQTVPTPNPSRTVLVDYAHTPDALKTALVSARPHCTGRLIALFGAGGDRDPAKRPMMGKIAADYADLGLVCDDNPRTEDPATIRTQILAANSNLVDAGERDGAIHRALTEMNDGDCLVIAGKGHEDYQEIMGVKQPFDDAKTAQAAATELWS